MPGPDELPGRIRARQALDEVRRAGLAGQGLALFDALADSHDALSEAVPRHRDLLGLTLQEAGQMGQPVDAILLDASHGGLPFERGCDALGLACHCGLERDVALLLHAGADPDGHRDKHAATACAAHAGRSGALRILLQAGADARDDSFGRHPLLWRLSSRVMTPTLAECFELLLAHPQASSDLNDASRFAALIDNARSEPFRQRLLAERAKREARALGECAHHGDASPAPRL